MSGLEARRVPLAPNWLDRLLAGGAALMLIAELTAIARGHATWDRVPAVIWLHLATITIALALTPVMLLRRRGDPLHRRLGAIWLVAMFATALISLTVHELNPPRGFSLIHLISLYVMVSVPLIWRAARRGNIRRHRNAIRGMVTGALLIAGFFTFPFHRLLGAWLFG